MKARLEALFQDGWDHWDRFDSEVRQRSFHPFVHADFEVVLDALETLQRPGARFLEWGSGTGVITIMADLLGFEAYGIELDEGLVAIARKLAGEHGSGARFAAGSFLPSGYRWRPGGRGADRMGTIGSGTSGYLELGLPLDEFHLVYAYPWTGEEDLMLDLMRQYGSRDAGLLLYRGNQTVECHRRGQIEVVGNPA